MHKSNRPHNTIQFVDIDNVDDPRLAMYCNIKEKDITGRQSRFIAEGKVVLRVLLTSTLFEAESLLISQNKIDGLTDLLSLCPPDVPIYCVTSGVMDGIAGFNVHRGILAVGKRKHQSAFHLHDLQNPNINNSGSPQNVAATRAIRSQAGSSVPALTCHDNAINEETTQPIQSSLNGSAPCAQPTAITTHISAPHPASVTSAGSSPLETPELDFSNDLNTLLDQLPSNSLIVVLCGISNHDNIGSIFRNAASFNADCVLLDETCCDPLYRKAIRVSVGATLQVPYLRQGNIEDIVSGLTAAGYNLLALSPAGSLSIYDFTPSGRQALLLGAEGEGLPKHLLNSLQTARIPMSADFDSLNVATASGIVLSRFYRPS